MTTTSAPRRDPYLLLFRNAGADVHARLTLEEKEQLTRRWNEWFDELTRSGKASHGAPLGLEGRVVSGDAGQRVTDGPYAEAKEVVGGYVMLTVSDLDEATAIARQVPGLIVGLTVEVRPVLAASPVLTGVNGHPA